MDTSLLLFLPRLHAELFPHDTNGLTLWPGLPDRPPHAWEPAMPWPAPMAAACLADYERACRDGASGSPVLAMGAEAAPADLSPAERRALREMAGLPVEQEVAPLRHTAQQVLLLLWLLEKQALDMAALEQKISTSRQALAGLISGRAKDSVPPVLPSEKDLPDWRKALFAALAFVEDMPASTAVAVTSAAMADALAGTGEPLPHGDSGKKAVRMEVSALAELCGRDACSLLKRGLEEKHWNRTLTFFLPETHR
ncbi:hypothetical protein [Mailhella massiliensis]|uniref:Uncharacterized protein n=1 Tax=Mailhella massiliensis TaxID=1903261 RepID=A0A921AXG0_9BACT|nr:hypothetical protein [Mailhella massiliensis]HJD97634.1 hypothetical protein [Mailhella massiliensis]